jgi:hypothetical protein
MRHHPLLALDQVLLPPIGIIAQPLVVLIETTEELSQLQSLDSRVRDAASPGR